MGFVKGMITGVLVVAGAVVGAAVVSVIKDEKKEKGENKKSDARESKASGNNGEVIFSGIRNAGKVQFCGKSHLEKVFHRSSQL